MIHQYRRFPHKTVVNSMAITPQPVSYTHLTLPTN